MLPFWALAPVWVEQVSAKKHKEQVRWIPERSIYFYLFMSIMLVTFECYLFALWKINGQITGQRREQMIYRATSICMEKSYREQIHLKSIFLNSGYLCPDGMCTDTDVLSHERSLGCGDVQGMETWKGNFKYCNPLSVPFPVLGEKTPKVYF